MTPHYDNIDCSRAYEKEAERWLGVRFRANSADPKNGISCDRLQYELHRAGLAIPALELPTVAMDHGWHSDVSVLRDFLEPLEEYGLQPLDPSEPWMTGDLCTLQWGRCDHHLAGYFGYGKLIHADFRLGVVMEPMSGMRGGRCIEDMIVSRWRFYR